jgi:2-polyprenyl-3-methyl-5-hydroxy-6-metoxy-1,4-benzoquinol methylase
MFEFHTDRKRYFDIQVANAAAFVLPFIEEKYTIKPDMRVLEIGSGEGGVLKPFMERGCTGIGVEFDLVRIEFGKMWMGKEIEEGRLTLLGKDIYDVDAVDELGGNFDIIILKDVIEHIHDQRKLIGHLKVFLKPDGVIFFGFPPWQMPFGGHQQICKNKWLSRLPYFHLLPSFLYRMILKLARENVDEMMEIKQTGISIERFETICKQQGYELLHRKHYLINPIYQWKFGWKPKTQFKLISTLPFIRNFLTTCVYYLIRQK